jgi:hypothetical protein
MKMSPIKLMLIVLSISLANCAKETKTVAPAQIIVDPVITFFSDEIRPAKTKPCFNGAYYRKLVSSSDVWLGIGGKVTLPTITFDPERVNPLKPNQFLDNPSVYIGGNMSGQETDLGLTWEVIRDANGNVTADRRAFRPFLRRTSFSSGQLAIYENAPAQAQYYWYPGDEVEISVQIISDKKLRFIVEGEGKRFERDFDLDGYRAGVRGEFKRVNAIDQVANEGKPVQATKTKVENSVWTNTYLFRSYQNKVIQVPAHSSRLTDMRCPTSNNFKISATDADLKMGAENININGAGY